MEVTRRVYQPVALGVIMTKSNLCHIFSGFVIRSKQSRISLACRSRPAQGLTLRCFGSSENDNPSPKIPLTNEIPFYGLPRIPREHRSVWNRFAVAAHSATTAFSDPVRGDAVAALGEITGSVSLVRILEKMKDHPTGRQLLQDRPIISKATIPHDRLIADAPDDMNDVSNITFGQAYGYFLKTNGFDPDERAAVRYIEDDELAWVMLRYRQVCMCAHRSTLSCLLLTHRRDEANPFLSWCFCYATPMSYLTTF